MCCRQPCLHQPLYHVHLQALLASVTSDADLMSLVLKVSDVSVKLLLQLGAVCSLWRACTLRRLRELATTEQLKYRQFYEIYVIKPAQMSLISAAYDDTVAMERSEDAGHFVGVAAQQSFTIRATSMGRLRGLTWVNDEIIDGFMWLLGVCPNVLCASTYFWTCLSEGRTLHRWYRNAVLADLHRILVPMNMDGNHWTLMVVNLSLCRLEYYDSLFGQPPPTAVQLLTVRLNAPHANNHTS